MKLTPEEKALIAEMVSIEKELRMKNLSKYTKKKLKNRIKEISNTLNPDSD